MDQAVDRQLIADDGFLIRFVRKEFRVNDDS
jgi:hypothetical protein